MPGYEDRREWALNGLAFPIRRTSQTITRKKGSRKLASQ
jgi:hypothetical protein